MPPFRSTHRQIRMVDWSQVKASFIWAYEAAIPAEFHDRRDHLPGLSALLIRAGSLRIETEDGVREAREGQWIFPHQGERRQLIAPGTEVISLHFHLTWVGGRPVFDWPVALVLDAANHPLLEKKARHLIQKVNRLMPDAHAALPWMETSIETHFRIQPSFAAWLCAFVEVMTQTGHEPSRLVGMDERTFRAVTILDEIPIGALVPEKELAKRVGTSLSQLNRLFVAEFGVTPTQYQDRKKITHARYLVSAGALSIKQIAYELGFASLPAFSRWFRQKTGSSPRTYQQGPA